MVASLSLAKDGSKIELVPDNPTVTVDENMTPAILLGAVLQLDSCLHCKAPVEPSSPPLGRCSKQDCAVLQSYNICSEHISAKIIAI